MRTLNPVIQPETFWARLRDGADAPQVFDRIRRSVDDVDITFAGGPERSEDLENLEQVDNIPLVLAGLMGLMAAAVLTHVLVSAVRVRRRDLAILKTLGLGRRQTGSVVRWQATTYAVVGLVVAIPLGVALSRWVWRLFAQNLGVIPEPWLPWWVIAGTIVSVLVVAYAAAAMPALLAARARPAAILRAE